MEGLLDGGGSSTLNHRSVTYTGDLAGREGRRWEDIKMERPPTASGAGMEFETPIAQPISFTNERWSSIEQSPGMDPVRLPGAESVDSTEERGQETNELSAAISEKEECRGDGRDEPPSTRATGGVDSRESQRDGGRSARNVDAMEGVEGEEKGKAGQKGAKGGAKGGGRGGKVKAKAGAKSAKGSKNIAVG